MWFESRVVSYDEIICRGLKLLTKQQKQHITSAETTSHTEQQTMHLPSYDTERLKDLTLVTLGCNGLVKASNICEDNQTLME